jgi:hypothetical protein
LKHFNTHQLSQTPGGQTVIIQLADGRSLIHFRVKYPAPYIQKVLCEVLNLPAITPADLEKHVALMAVGTRVLHPKFKPEHLQKLESLVAAARKRKGFVTSINAVV